MRIAGWRGWLALFAGLSFTALTVTASLAWRYAEQQQRFQVETESREQLLAGRVQEAAAAFAALATLFMADQYVDADQFRLLAQGLIARWPFLRAAFYAPRVRSADRTGFEAAVRDLGLPGFRIRTAAEIELHYPVRYFEPFSPLSARLLGLDLATFLHLATAITEAAARDATVIAVGPGLSGAQPEYWLLRALYASRGRPDAAQRARLANGVVGLALEPARLAAGIQVPGDRLRLSLYNGVEVESLFDTGMETEQRMFRIVQRYEVPFANLRLVAQFERSLSLTHLVSDHCVAAVLLGLAATFLFLALAAHITARRRAESALRRSYAELEQRVRERTAELEEASRKLEASNNELQQFAYVISHDLQEPLRMVSSYLKLLSRRYRNKLDQDADEFIGFAVDGARRMATMIDGLLQYSRVETQGEPFADTDLEQVLAEALANLRLAVEESAAEITHSPLPTVAADADQMERLLQNLIGNALKFRKDAPPKVRIEARRQEREWVVSVADNGIGISPEQTEHIFAMFQRLHTREEYPGLGIGLAVCKRIVERHGGRIWVESRAHEGATFYFTLPGEK